MLKGNLDKDSAIKLLTDANGNIQEALKKAK